MRRDRGEYIGRPGFSDEGYQGKHTQSLDGIGRYFADDARTDLRVQRLPGEVQITLEGVVYSVRVRYSV